MVDVSNLPKLIEILIMGLQSLMLIVTSIKIYKIIRRRNELEKNNEGLSGMYSFLVWFIAFFYNSGVISTVLFIDILAFFIVKIMFM
jgi:hypothetical protein